MFPAEVSFILSVLGLLYSLERGAIAMLDFLIGLFSIIIIDLVVSGDNAMVIALASRKLPESQRKKASRTWSNQAFNHGQGYGRSSKPTGIG